MRWFCWANSTLITYISISNTLPRPTSTNVFFRRKIEFDVCTNINAQQLWLRPETDILIKSSREFFGLMALFATQKYKYTQEVDSCIYRCCLFPYMPNWWGQKLIGYEFEAMFLFFHFNNFFVFLSLPFFPWPECVFKENKFSTHAHLVVSLGNWARNR